MKISVMLVAMASLATIALWGQAPKAPQGVTTQPNQTDSAITAETRKVFEATSANILTAAKTMPPASYNFKPEGGDRSFGELVTHIADVQNTLCNNINNHHTRPATTPTTKDNIIKDLSTSIAECHTAFAELSAENAGKTVQAPAGEVTHLAALIYIITHASEEYGQLGVYLRLNHLAPPTNDAPKGGPAGKA